MSVLKGVDQLFLNKSNKKQKHCECEMNFEKHIWTPLGRNIELFFYIWV